MRDRKRPWIPETSGERIGPAPKYDEINMVDWEQDRIKREENERALRPNDGYYRDSSGFLTKVTNGPYVNGRHWERLQRRKQY
jgi:hypothetical protein